MQTPRTLFLDGIQIVAGLGLALAIVLVAYRITRYVSNIRHAKADNAERLAARQKALTAWKEAERLAIYVKGADYDALILRLTSVLDQLGDSRHLGEHITNRSRETLRRVRTHWHTTLKTANQWNPADDKRTLTRYAEILDRLEDLKEQFEEARRAYDQLVRFCDESEMRLATQQEGIDALWLDTIALAAEVDALEANGIHVGPLKKQLSVIRGFVTATRNRIAEGDIFEAAKELDRTTRVYGTIAEAVTALKRRHAELDDALEELESVVADASAAAVTAMERYEEDTRDEVRRLLEIILAAYGLLEVQLRAYEMHLVDKNAPGAEAAGVAVRGFASTITQVHDLLQRY